VVIAAVSLVLVQFIRTEPVAVPVPVVVE
jgi:hypothetical protein